MFLTEEGDEITHRVGNFVTPNKNEKKWAKVMA
jgi:hypothetical protein